MTTQKPALIIFIRNPERGKVKTRIAQSVGEEKAYQVYLSLLSHIRLLAEKVEGVECYLYYSHFIDEMDEWDSRVFNKRVQSSGDIGTKMDRAFGEVLNDHPAAVIVGSDIASLTTAIIQDAFLALHTKDYVLGPALDGGYYLLGMKTPSPHLFENMIWSTDEVFQMTSDRITQMGASLGIVDKLSDIDYWEDWEKYGWEI